MKVAALVAALVALLGAAVWAASQLWAQLGVDIGLFGWAVIGAGGVLTIALGVGLMALSFHSARGGYDQRAHDASDQLDRTGQTGAPASPERALDRRGARDD